VPPSFASYAEWETWVERLTRLGVTEEYTRIWWDVRPHPKLGTLEVRVPDQPTDVHLSAAFTALLQALCASALDGVLPRNEGTLGDCGRADYVQNRWSAARFGPRAKLLHPDGQSYVRASELAAELFELVRPAARELGGEAFLDRIDPSGCEADLQLAGDTAQEATAQLVQRSLG
jgi:carboxylate-amine ligase